MNRQEDFYQISAALTGYDRSRLTGIGVGDDYYHVLTNLVSEEILNKLFDCFNRIDSQCNGGDLEQKIREEILASQEFGPVARNIIKMWYLSIWYQLPDDWRQLYGAPSQSPQTYQDEQFIVSRNAYIQGLVWNALGTHPMGAKQPGYGTWALPPSGLSACTTLSGQE